MLLQGQAYASLLSSCTGGIKLCYWPIVAANYTSPLQRVRGVESRLQSPLPSPMLPHLLSSCTMSADPNAITQNVWVSVKVWEGLPTLLTICRSFVSLQHAGSRTASRTGGLIQRQNGSIEFGSTAKCMERTEKELFSSRS